jgi:ABC-type sugar transport system permease subunit
VTELPTSAVSADGEATPILWRNVALGGAALLLAMPAVFGGLGSLIPAILHPDGKMPAVTDFDQAVIAVFTWSVLLVLISPPATLLAAIIGAWAAKRAGWKTAFSRTILVIVGVAFVLTAASYIRTWMSMQRHPEFRQGIPVQ